MTSAITKMIRALERARERAKAEQRRHRRVLAADRYAAALADARRLDWPRVRIGARSAGIQVQGEAAWRALLEDPQTDIAAVDAALGHHHSLRAVLAAALPPETVSQQERGCSKTVRQRST
jgi:hypothetical protein